MEDYELGWVAGLFEGEGSITFTGRASVRVSLGSTDKDVVDSLHRLFPAGNTYRREVKNRIKPLYIWRIDSCEEVEDFLESVLPYLHSRRKAKAKAALKRLEDNPGARGRQTHCVNGHPLSGSNLYIRPYNGTRSCRMCREAADKRRTAKRQAGRSGEA